MRWLRHRIDPAILIIGGTCSFRRNHQGTHRCFRCARPTEQLALPWLDRAFQHFAAGVVFAAVAAAAAEHVLPVLLVIGLGVRLSALGLLGMTMVIQLFVYPEAWWPVHSLWAALALVLIARGGGALALDALFSRFAR